MKERFLHLWVADILIVVTSFMGLHNYGLEYDRYYLTGTNAVFLYDDYCLITYSDNGQIFGPFPAEIFWNKQYICIIDHKWNETIESSTCYLCNKMSDSKYEVYTPYTFSDLKADLQIRGVDINKMHHIDYTNDSFQRMIQMRVIIAWVELLLLLLLPLLLFLGFCKKHTVKRSK